MTEAAREFRFLRLSGGRFDAASTGAVGFPLDIIGELARYERLLIQVARGLWLTENADRQRAPKGFDESLRLRLTAVEDGSVAPVFQRRTTEGQLFDLDPWIDRSQETIGDAISAVVEGQPLPAGFPGSATSSLVQFGSGLGPDEVCHVSRNGEGEVPYTQEARRHLVTIVSAEDIKIQGQLVGRVSAIDANRQTFEFVDREGRRVDGRFEQLGLLYVMRDAIDRDPRAPFVRLSCRYSADAQGRLSVINEVDDFEIVVAPDDLLGAKLWRLLELKNAWRDGEGLAPHVSAVEWARDFAEEAGDVLVSDLRVFPTMEGGVLIEKQWNRHRWSLEVDAEGEAFLVVVDAEGNTASQEPPDAATAAENLRQFLDGR